MNTELFLVLSYFGKLEHGSHGGLILNKVIFYISIIGQVC